MRMPLSNAPRSRPPSAPGGKCRLIDPRSGFPSPQRALSLAPIQRAETSGQAMDFDFSDDQKFLKTEARKFLDARCGVGVVRGVLDDPAASYDQGLWKAVAGQGWLGAAIPEADGGLGLGHIELCAIAEELGRALAPIPFSSTLYFVAEATI